MQSTKRRKAAEEIQDSKVGIEAYGDNFWDSEGTRGSRTEATWEVIARSPCFTRQCICPHGAGFEAGPEGHGLSEIDHPPYSPDLAPSDYFLFSNLKGVTGNQLINDCQYDFQSSRPAVDLLTLLTHRWVENIESNGEVDCRYCMPAEGVQLTPRDALLTPAELEKLVQVFAMLGVHKVRLTGGEPTLRAELPALVSRLKAVPGLHTIALTTNGLLLTRLLPALHRAGLDALNVSLDSLHAERYERMSRRPGRGLARVLAGIDLALQLGYAPVKINCVLMKEHGAKWGQYHQSQEKYELCNGDFSYRRVSPHLGLLLFTSARFWFNGFLTVWRRLNDSAFASHGMTVGY
ncbi:Molybdenum cofactor biosynthesis protein 1 [Eumeta japonica]|uniref:Molybdenum cofactor biosynthesis protein 1 n=1 Tax=Eumeta variegata TaxID=151549 RepID=A0A4C1Z2E2_EUMVA|nr:Molybdenum cofactor biosynthesis protein 1 [Eumeta japonica]